MTPRTPEDCDRLFAEHVNAGRLDELVALYEPTAVLLGVDRQQAVGPAAIRAALGALIETRAVMRMNVVRSVRAGDDLAVLYNHWSMEANGPGGAPVTMTGRAIEVVRRQPDGTWRFVVDDPIAGSETDAPS